MSSESPTASSLPPEAPTPSLLPEGELRLAHTYQDDVARAMNATDAAVVQELLETAREKEVQQKAYSTSIHQRKWYSVYAVSLILLALIGFVFAFIYYTRLTVPIQERVSVGVFPNTAPIAIDQTDIRQTLSTLALDGTLKEGKPTLVPLVTDSSTLTPITKESFFSFIEARPSEPFAAAIDTIRLGTMNTGEKNVPFIILSAYDQQIISKELLIAEPQLLSLFYRSLSIDLSKYIARAGEEFQGVYRYNLPLRVLPQDPTTVEGTMAPILLYGFVSDRVVVITTDDNVLKAVYDMLVRQ